MRVKSIGDIVKEVCTLQNFKKQEKLDILRKNDHPGLRLFLDILFNEQIRWALPERVEYTPNVQLDCDGQLYKELRRLYLFTEQGNPNLAPERRLHLFVQLLEAVTPEDAKLLVAMKDHNPPKGITKKLVEEAYGA